MNILTKYNAYLKLFGLTKIPLLLFVNPRITKLTQEEVEVKIPLNWRTKNHLKSMYFGSLAIGVDTAGGLLATRFIQESKKKVHLSFKDFQANFLKRAQSDAYFVNTQGKEIKNLVDEIIASPGLRKNLTLRVDVFSKNEMVANCFITLSLKMNAPTPS